MKTRLTIALLAFSTLLGSPAFAQNVVAGEPTAADIGKDQAQQKATYPAVFGLPKSHEIARDLATRAMAELEPFGARAANLRTVGEFLVLRRA